MVFKHSPRLPNEELLGQCDVPYHPLLGDICICCGQKLEHGRHHGQLLVELDVHVLATIRHRLGQLAIKVLDRLEHKM